MTFLDTHVVVWLYGGYLEKISENAKVTIENEDLYISPIVMLELQYLFEIDRIKSTALDIYEDLHFRIGLKLEETSWSYIVKHALKGQTRDPFDRLIIAHADALNAKLLTKDQNILSLYDKACW